MRIAKSGLEVADFRVSRECRFSPFARFRNKKEKNEKQLKSAESLFTEQSWLLTK